MKTEAQKAIAAVKEYRCTGVIPGLLLDCVDFPPESGVNPYSRIYHERDVMNQVEILAGAEHFRKTGKIPSALSTLYDQHGIWVGKHHPHLTVIDDELQSRLRRKTLAKSRRFTRTKRHGAVLLTSYVRKPKHKGPLPWHEIKGFVKIGTIDEVEAPYLHSVGLGVYLKHPGKVHLPNLRQAFSLETEDAEEIHIPKLTRVEVLRSCVRTFSAPCLESVGSDLILRYATAVNMPLLRSVGDNLSAKSALEFHAPLLKFVGGRLTACGNPPVPSLLTADAQ